ncbi:MAG: hypothetical protein VYB54_15715 [Pseudomonadota bacterium]|nr:hypothetical protein [Pseudomonadota bacterium]
MSFRSFVPCLVMLVAIATMAMAADRRSPTPEVMTQVCLNDPDGCRAIYEVATVAFLRGIAYAATVAKQDPDRANRAIREVSVRDITLRGTGFCIRDSTDAATITQWVRSYVESQRTNSEGHDLFDMIGPALRASYPCR